jgi:hypothetical protein
MKQQTLAMAADQGFEQHRRPTRRDELLDTMHRIVPWEALCAVVALSEARQRAAANRTGAHAAN